MSYQVENTEEELDLLKGAVIVSATIVSVEEQQRRARIRGETGVEWIEQSALQLVVRYRKNLVVNESVIGTFQIWQDEEGNGPGYVAYVGGSEAA